MKKNKDNHNKPVLLVDDTCAFCNRSVAFIIRHGGEGNMEFKSLFKDDGKELMKRFGLPEDYDQSIVFIEKGRAYVKSGAALRVTKYLNIWWKPFFIFIIVPRPIRDFFYMLVSKHRHRLL